VTDEGADAWPEGDATGDPAELMGPEVKRAPLPKWWWDQSLGTRRLIAGVLFGVIVLAAAALLWNLFSDGGSDPYEEAYLFVEALPEETVAVWDALAECETNSDWTKNTGNGFYGGLQFEIQSWQDVGGEGIPSNTPREEQIYRADKLRQLQGWQAWPACAAQLGLT